MKKIFLALAIIMVVGLSANAQFDSFITEDGDYYRQGDVMPNTPSGGLGINTNEPAGVPLGSGLLIFTALGAGYALSRKRKLAN